jgi:hypothetical protein
MPALWPTSADDLKHRWTFPRGLGSASEAYCPTRLGPGGAFCHNWPTARAPDFTRKLTRPVEPKEGPCVEPMTLADAAKFVGQRAPAAALAPCWDYAAELLLTAATTGRRKDVEGATAQMERALTRERWL